MRNTRIFRIKKIRILLYENEAFQFITDIIQKDSGLKRSQKGGKHIFRGRLPGLSVLFVLFFFFPVPGYSGDIFVYNPESPTSGIFFVKQELKRYLAIHGLHSRIHFFAHPEDFDAAVFRLKPDAAIVASYYYQEKKDEYGWKEILQGHFQGKRFFHKVLVAERSIVNMKELSGKSVAAVTTGNDILKNGGELSEKWGKPGVYFPVAIRLVSVSKDIDAIMALGFGQVDAAVVTRDSMEKLRKINPEVVRNLYILKELSPVHYPKFVVFPDAGWQKAYKDAFMKIHRVRSARLILYYLGITGFEEGS